MSELTKKIENMLDECKEFVKYPPGRIIIAHKITYLISQEKSGVVTVSKCFSCDGNGSFFWGVDPDYPTEERPCYTCHGSGEITRELTDKECAEVLKELNKQVWSESGIRGFTLPDGSILRGRE
jgi:hypothetical protein